MILIFTRNNNSLNVNIIKSTCNIICGVYVSLGLSIVQTFIDGLMNCDYNLELKIDILQSMKKSMVMHLIDTSAPLKSQMLNHDLCLALINGALDELTNTHRPEHKPNTDGILYKILNRR